MAQPQVKVTNFPDAVVGVPVIGSVATSALGTEWVALGAQACARVEVINDTGTKLLLRRNGGGNTLPLYDGFARLFRGITNASQLQVRRADSSNTPVTVTWESYAVQ